jgi:hypothetical protein
MTNNPARGGQAMTNQFQMANERVTKISNKKFWEFNNWDFENCLEIGIWDLVILAHGASVVGECSNCSEVIL